MLRIYYVNKSLQYSDCVYSMLNVPFEAKSLDCVLICYAELRTLNLYLFMDVNIYICKGKSNNYSLQIITKRVNQFHDAKSQCFIIATVPQLLFISGNLC